MKCLKVLVFVFAAIMCSGILRADELVFRNRDRLSGTVMEVSGGTIKFDGELVGEVQVELSRVRSFTVTDGEGEREIRLQNDDTLTGVLVEYSEGDLVVETETDGAVSVPMEDVRSIGRPHSPSGESKLPGTLSTDRSEMSDDDESALRASVKEEEAKDKSGIVLLESGDRISGTVERMTDDELVLETDAGGTLNIPMGKVRTLSTTDSVELHLTDGTVLKDRLEPGGDGRVRTAGEGDTEAQSLRLSRLNSINPPPPPGPEWTVNVAANYTVTTGNSNTTSSSVDLGFKRESTASLFKTAWMYQYATEEDEDTGEDDTTRDVLTGKTNYDYYLGDEWFAYGLGLFRRDTVADLDARLNLGSGLGYRWWDTDIFSFSTRAGLGWTYEDFDDGDDDTSAASAQAGYELEARPIERIRFIHETLVSPSLENTSNYYLSSSAELRTKLIEPFYLTLKSILDYDSEPADDADTTDFTHMLGVGAEF